MAKDKKLLEMVQQTIEQAATTAEEIQKAVADLPLQLLEDNGLLVRPVREIRRTQERTIGAIYDLVRRINRRMGAFVADLLAQPARSVASDPKAAHRAA